MKKLTLLIFVIALFFLGCKDDKEVVYVLHGHHHIDSVEHIHVYQPDCTCGIVVDKYPLDTFIAFELKNLCSDNILLSIQTVVNMDDKEIADTICVNHKW